MIFSTIHRKDLDFCPGLEEFAICHDIKDRARDFSPT
jgi:hypothetical protein